MKSPKTIESDLNFNVTRKVSQYFGSFANFPTSNVCLVQLSGPILNLE